VDLIEFNLQSAVSSLQIHSQFTIFFSGISSIGGQIIQTPAK